MRDEFVPRISRLVRTGAGFREDYQRAFSADGFLFTSNGGDEAIYNELLELAEELKTLVPGTMKPAERERLLAEKYQSSRRQSLHCLLVEGNVEPEQLETLLEKLRALPGNQRVAAELYSERGPYIGGVYAFYNPSDRNLSRRSITEELQARLDEFFVPWTLLEELEFSVRAIPVASMRLGTMDPEDIMVELVWGHTKEDELLNLLVPSTF